MPAMVILISLVTVSCRVSPATAGSPVGRNHSRRVIECPSPASRKCQWYRLVSNEKSTLPGGEISAMCTAAVPASADEALRMLPSLLGVLAGADPAGQPAAAAAGALHILEQADAVGAAVRGRYLAAFDAQDGHLADGQRTSRNWLVHCTQVTWGQAGEHRRAGAGPGAPGPVGRAGRGLCAYQVRRAAACQVDPAGPGGIPGPGRRSWSPRPGPGRTCGHWRRSAPRSGTRPRARTRTTRKTSTWTGACRSTPPSTGPE